MGDSHSPPWSSAIIMGFQVLLGSLLACTVSSVPLDAGYGVPAAPLLVSQPVAGPLLHSVPAPVRLPPQPFVHAAQFNYAPDFLPFAPEPLALGPEQPALIPDHLRFAPKPHFIGPAPITTPIAAPISAPIAAPLTAPITAPSSQFHAQDEFGQFSFGYENINSAKQETKDAFGVTRGRYQYVDANGIVQTVNYISDDINGFRVSGTNLPVAPAALPVVPAAPLLAPVKETPEVAKARAEHLAAHEEAKAATESVEKTKREAAEDGSEPEPEPEPQDKKKREAEPIKVPAAPVIVSAGVPLPVTTSQLHHGVSPVVGPLQAALLPSHQPFHTSLPFPSQPINYAPDFLPFAPEPLPFGPEQIAVVPEQLRFAPEAHFLAPDFIPAAVPGPIAAPLTAPTATPIAAPIAAPLAAPIAAPIPAPLA